MRTFQSTSAMMNLSLVANAMQQPTESLFTGEFRTEFITTDLFRVSIVTNSALNQGLVSTTTYFEVKVHLPDENRDIKKTFDSIIDADKWIENKMMAILKCKKITFNLTMPRSEYQISKNTYTVGGIKIKDCIYHNDESMTGFVKTESFDSLMDLDGFELLKESGGNTELGNFVLPKDEPIKAIKQGYMVTTVDSEYNEDSMIIKTSLDLCAMSEDELIEALDGVMIISEDDRVTVTEISSTQVVEI